MTQQWASVIPFEDWSDGFANVMPLPPGPTDMPTVIPLIHEDQGTYPVQRGQYPMGVVILASGPPPPGPPAELALIWVDGDTYSPDGTGPDPNGVVILFRGR